VRPLLLWPGLFPFSFTLVVISFFSFVVCLMLCRGSVRAFISFSFRFPSFSLFHFVASCFFLSFHASQALAGDAEQRTLAGGDLG